MCMLFTAIHQRGWDINSSWSFKDEDPGDQNHKQGEMSSVRLCVDWLCQDICL